MIPQAVIKLLLPKVVDHMMKIFKLDKVLHYVEEDNELDVAMRNNEEKMMEINLKLKAMESVLKDLGQDSHPPAIPVKEINEMKKMKDEFTQVKKVINKLKKLPLLKSVFK